MSDPKYNAAYDYSNSSGLVMAHFGQPLEFTENGIDFQEGAQINVTYIFVWIVFIA